MWLFATYEWDSIARGLEICWPAPLEHWMWCRWEAVKLHRFTTTLIRQLLRAAKSSWFIPAQHMVIVPLQSNTRSISSLLAPLLEQQSLPAKTQSDFPVLFPQQDHVLSAQDPHSLWQHRTLSPAVCCLHLVLLLELTCIPKAGKES